MSEAVDKNSTEEELVELTNQLNNLGLNTSLDNLPRQSGAIWCLAQQVPSKLSGSGKALQVLHRLSNPGSGPPGWLTQPHLLTINNLHPVMPGRPNVEPGFSDLLSALGIDKDLLRDKNTKEEITEDVNMVVTDGDVNYRGSGIAITNHTVVLLYEVKSNGKQVRPSVCLVRVIVDPTNFDLALSQLTMQRFGASAPEDVARVIASMDSKRAKQIVDSFNLSFGVSDELLRLTISSIGKIPIVSDAKLKPHFDLHNMEYCPELLVTFWDLFGLSVFETQSFLKSLSERQYQFRKAFNDASPSEAMHYVHSNATVVRYGSDLRRLAINGVPDQHMTRSMVDIIMLFYKFGDGLKQQLLKSKNTLSCVMISCQRSVNRESSKDPQERAVQEIISNLLNVLKKGSYIYANLAKPRNSQEKRLHQEAQILDGSHYANKFSNGETKHVFGIDDRIVGTVARSGLAYCTEQNLFLVPSKNGMTVSYFVRDSSGKITPYFLIIKIKFRSRTWRFFRRIFNLPPVVELVTPEYLPHIVVGACGDTENRIFAFEAINPSNSGQTVFEPLYQD